MCKRVMLPNSPEPCHHNVPAVFPSPLPHAMYTCDKGTSSSLGWVVNLQLAGAVIWCWAPHVLMAQLLLVMGLKACRSACSLYLCASESPGEVWFELPTLALYCPRVIWFFARGVRFFWDAHLLDIFFLEVFCLFYICFYLFFFDIGFHWVAQVGLELVAMLLPQPPKNWDCEPTQRVAGSFTELSYSITPMPLISSSLCSVEPGRLCELQLRQGREQTGSSVFFFLSCASNLSHSFYMGYSLSLIKVTIKIKSQIKTSKENESLEI